MFSHPVTVGELLIACAVLVLGYAALAWWAAGQESEAHEEREAMGDAYDVAHTGPRVVELQKR